MTVGTRARLQADEAHSAPGTEKRGKAGFDRTVLTILALSTVFKLVLAVIADRHASVLDESAYLHIANTLLQSGRFETTFRPPLYPGFMAAVMGLGFGTLGIRVIQVLLSSVSAWLIYRIAGQYLDRRGARIALVLVALNPILITFSHRLWSESLYIFFLTLTVWLLVSDGGRRSLTRWIAAGVTLGLAGLTRPMILTFAPLLLVWALLEFARKQSTPLMSLRTWRSALFAIVVLGAASSLVVLPWTLRNAQRTGAFILVDTNAPFNFLVGTQKESAFVDKDDLWNERFGMVDGKRYEEYVLQNPARAQELAMSAAWQNIRERPDVFLGKSLWEGSHLWTLDSFLLRHVRNGWYGKLPVPVAALVTIIAVLFFVILVLSGFAGLAATESTSYRSLTLLMLLHSTLLFALTYSLSRYGVPLQVLLSVPAAAFLSAPRRHLDLLKARGSRIRFTLLLCSILFVGSAWARDLPLLADMILRGGTEHRFRLVRDTPAVSIETRP